jgi:D-sedoheptulose 7-phosphate isomerase
MDHKTFLTGYYEEYSRLLINEAVMDTIAEYAQLALGIKTAGGKMMFAGNGASASIAEHGAVDFTKQGGVRGVTFHDPNLMTCFANDFGYDHWMAKAIEHYGDAGDAAVLISCSGESPSVVNAAQKARDMGLKVVTFTGRDPGNALKELGDVNFHVPSHAYNVVENLHAIWLTSTIDLILGKSEYETRALV